jgi:c-di-AMP phosphodiesterase-like protein
MGHKMADLDAIGAAVGVCAGAYSLGVKSFVVLGDGECPAQPLLDKLRKNETFAGMFLTPREAMIRADSKTLLVVVDTNNPEQVEDNALLQTCTRVAVIDHHRRGAAYISNAVLTLLEPSASSASELVSELLMEIMKDGSLYSETAEALLAGIMLDTKNFTMRTGDHTFEAAAYLRREGANPTDVKRLLQSDVESNVQKYAIMQQAKAYRGVVIAAPDTPQNRVTAAKAADELLNIAGAEASIVIYPTADGAVFASARSIGELNVQLIMEKLGGGGNRAAAAARMTDISFEDAVKKLYTTIDEYLDD